LSDLLDSLISLRRLSFNRAAADVEQAVGDIHNLQDLLASRKDEANALQARRNSLSDRLQAKNAAHLLVQTWAYDQLLTEDLSGARKEQARVEDDLLQQQEKLSHKRTKLRATQARLLAVKNLNKRRRRATLRRQERHLEEEAADFHRARRF
jgi:hypothetical protein